MSTYNRNNAIEYARQWWSARNPKYANFDKMGGDCTNFISQSLFAGISEMNYTPTFGWYYNSLSNRTPAWSGVNELYRFLVTNKGAGPRGHECSIEKAQIGDICQLSFDGVKFSHSLIITRKDTDNIRIATHTDDSYDRDLFTYPAVKMRFVHIIN